jgi:hypothetical protein
MVYRDLLESLKSMTPEELDQQVQIALPDLKEIPKEMDSLPLHDVVSFDTIESLGMKNTRSSYDNNHHPTDYVFLVDWNWFEEERDETEGHTQNNQGP